MSAVKEIRDLAKMFKWDIHTDDTRREDTYLNGQHMVAVDYTRNGMIKRARRYEFVSIGHPKLCESTHSNHKKSDVRNWLVKLGH